MKIPAPPDRDRYLFQLRRDLVRLLEQPLSTEERPCPGCAISCTCASHSSTCCCRCSENCKDIAVQLSSDGERYPIEIRVLPLVYGLASLRVVAPCWSCQGHVSQHRILARPPQVWFYASSPIYIHLIGQYLADERAKQRCHHEWQVRSGSYAERHVPIFIIEPRMSPEEMNQSGTLDELQHDLFTLGRGFERLIRELARLELQQIVRDQPIARDAAGNPA